MKLEQNIAAPRDEGRSAEEERWPVQVTVKLCRCGRVWVDGNTKYCEGGHPYEYTEREYVPLGVSQKAESVGHRRPA